MIDVRMVSNILLPLDNDSTQLANYFILLEKHFSYDMFLDTVEDKVEQTVQGKKLCNCCFYF